MNRHYFNRTELLMGKAFMARLAETRVLLFGIGGVGGWCAECLVRSGLGRLTLVDPDVICATNINRQIQALAGNVGKPKAEEMRQRLLAIVPGVDIVVHKVRYDERTCGQFDLKQYDYVLDAIDTLGNKLLLIRRSLEAGVRFYSSMGAAGKLDPTQVRTARIGQTKHCPLARMVRKRLGQQGIRGQFMCVYSEELPRENRGRTFCGSAVCVCPDKDEDNLCLGKARINGTLAPVTAAFGLALAGLVIQDVARRVEEEAAAGKAKPEGEDPESEVRTPQADARADSAD